MIDLHTHVLPGVDDGADDLPTALAMCRLAAADGCTDLVATPHQRTQHWENTNTERLQAVWRSIERAVDGLRVHLGAEVRVDSFLLEDLAQPDRAGVLSLAGSRYLLLELDRYAPFDRVIALTEELRVAGWLPIYAHPELIPWLAGDLLMLEELAAAGALFQITASSLTGEAGRPLRSLCRRLMDRELVDFVASDTHGTTWRPPGLTKARRAIERGWGEARAERLTRTNPLAVLRDEPLAAAAA